jgi:hypothetical protein
MSVGAAVVQLGWLGVQARSARRFHRALRHPERAQQRRLAELVSVLGPSAYGRHVGLDRVRTLADLQRLPVADYEALSPWVDRIAAGEAGVLSTEPVEVLEPTGGSTGGTKLVPTTARLRAELATAVGAWMVDLHRHLPGLIGTRQYWSVSRAVREHRTTAGGMPIGFDDDASYFGDLEQRAIRRLMAVPSEVAGAPSAEAWRHATAVALIEARDLGLISVWSPTFLTVLLDWMAAHRSALRRSLSPKARWRLDLAWDGTELLGPRLWPQLQLVSAWGDGFAARHLGALARRFPGVHIQPKGVLATEGVVSIPLWGRDGHVLAVTGHVLELRDVGTGDVVPWSEVAVGSEVQPLLTTGGGFVRYALPDRLRVVGFEGRVPRVRLLGRLDHGSDRVGEKLTAAFVDRALSTLWTDDAPAFAMLVPVDLEPPHYTLVVQGAAPTADAVDAALAEAYHYRLARELGQLGPARVRIVADGWRRWEQGLEAAGLRLGDQKPHVLETRPAVARALLAPD